MSGPSYEAKGYEVSLLVRGLPIMDFEGEMGGVGEERGAALADVRKAYSCLRL